MLNWNPRNLLRGFLFAVSVFSSQPACADILIGVAGPMTGQNGIFGQQMKMGVDAAVTAINQSGGINGEPLAAISADDACDAKRAETAAREFVAKDVRLVVGHFCSGASLAAASVYQSSGLVMISPAATSPALTEFANNVLFRVVPRDDSQVDIALARIATDHPSATVVAVVEEGASFAQFAKRFLELKPSALVRKYTPGKNEAAEIAAELAQANASVIYFAGTGGEVGKIVSALPQRFATLPKLFGSDAVLTDDFAKNGGANGEGLKLTYALDLTATPEAKRFLSTALSPESVSVASYASVEAFVAAARASSVNDTKAIARHMRSGSVYATAIGAISFDAKGDVRPQRFQWYQLVQGQFASEPGL
jgi:branched-chain amino acid transport system substrate-binding protein